MSKSENKSQVPELNSTTDEIIYEEILTTQQLVVLQEEFSRTKNACYLDHGGATLFSKSQLDLSTAELQSTLFSNPHSRNPSSSITTDATDYIRQRILSHFKTTEDEYSVIFTSGATAALKLVAESFTFNGGLFAYLEESHTSVVGMREFLLTNPNSFSSNHETKTSSPNQFKDQVANLNANGSSYTQEPLAIPIEDKFPARISNNNSMTFSSVCSSTEGASNGRVYCISKSTFDQLMDFDCSNCAVGSQDFQSDNTATANNEDILDPPDNQISKMCSLCLTCREQKAAKTFTQSIIKGNKNALFAYPAQCNFSGLKYSLERIKAIQNGHLEGISKVDQYYLDSLSQSEINSIIKSCNYKDKAELKRCIKCDECFNSQENSEQSRNNNGHNWFVLLDAASFVASNPLNLSINKADFVALSFYKMFGWPTGLGALLVKNESAFVLGSKRYFGGGTVNISIPSKPFHVKRLKLHERFEDGTISFLSILAVKHGLDTLSKLCGSMEVIRTRTFRLVQYLYKKMSNLKYPNGKPVARIYSDTLYTSEVTQGPVLTFNLLRSDGTIIGYSEMEQIAYLHDVHLRYGCFCNPGACRRHLGLTAEQVLKHFEAGHVCGDLRDIIDGQPTGAIRVSFGYMNTREHADFLLQLIYKCWIEPLLKSRDEEKLVEIKRNSVETLENMRLLRIFVYPIKSCAPFEVRGTWVVGPHGLLYDREWLIVNSAGVPLTAKREPRLCQIQPTIDISNRRLYLHYNGYEDVSIALEIEKTGQDSNGKKNAVKAELCTSKVCGDTVIGLDCGEEVSNWLSLVLDKPGLKLIRMSPDHHRKPRNSLDEISLANQSQFLLLSMASLRRLARELISKRLLSSLNINSIEEELEKKNPKGISTDEPHFMARGTSINYKKGDQDHSSLQIPLQYDDYLNDGSCGGNSIGVDYQSDAQHSLGRNTRNEDQPDGLIGKSRDVHQRPDNEFQVIESLIGRFRGNFIVSDISNPGDNLLSNWADYEEESWKHIQIGSSVFESGGPCIRCATICMDPITGTRSSEPLLTLSEIRGGRPNFGIHLYALPSDRTENNNNTWTSKSNPSQVIRTMNIGDIVQVTKYISDDKRNDNDQERFQTEINLHSASMPNCNKRNKNQMKLLNHANILPSSGAREFLENID